MGRVTPKKQPFFSTFKITRHPTHAEVPLALGNTGFLEVPIIENQGATCTSR